MSTAVGVMTNSAVLEPLTKLPGIRPYRQPEVLPREGYFESSEYYQLKGGFEAEIIQDPGRKIMAAGLFKQVTEELGDVLLKAFEQDESDADKFLSGDKLTKVAVWVDWLVVVRKKGNPVAFGAGSFVTPYLFYLNAAMVMPEYQPSGVGLVANALLWKIAVENAERQGYKEPDIVVRTHNRNVASVFLHSLRDVKLSTEPIRDLYTRMILERTAEYLNCKIDRLTGVSYDVYPEGLPAGTKTKNQRINDAFEWVGPRDACYISGRLNMSYLSKILKRCAQKYEHRVKLSDKVKLLGSVMNFA